jgi:hypothetical protein
MRSPRRPLTPQQPARINAARLTRRIPYECSGMSPERHECVEGPGCYVR